MHGNRGNHEQEVRGFLGKTLHQQRKCHASRVRIQRFCTRDYFDCDRGAECVCVCVCVCVCERVRERERE